DGHKDVAGEKYGSPVKVLRGDTDDGKRMFVELDHSAHYAAVFTEMRMPEAVGEHDEGSALGSVLVGAVIKATQIGLYTESVEVIAAGFIKPDTRGIVAGVESCAVQVVNCKFFKAVVAIT